MEAETDPVQLGRVERGREVIHRVPHSGRVIAERTFDGGAGGIAGDIRTRLVRLTTPARTNMRRLHPGRAIPRAHRHVGQEVSL